MLLTEVTKNKRRKKAVRITRWADPCSRTVKVTR